MLRDAEGGAMHQTNYYLWGLTASSFCATVLQWSSISIIYYIILFLNLINEKLDVPKIEPINVKQYEFKQSPYPQADKLPFRSIIVSASQGGKGILIQNLVLKIYRGCFERIWIVSPTAHIDEAYKEVIKYIQKELNVDNKKKIFVWWVWWRRITKNHRHTT